MSEKTKAVVKYAAFEYEGTFSEVVFDTSHLVAACQAMYAALKPWKVSPKDVKYKGLVPSGADPVISFEVSQGKYIINVAHSGIGLTVQWVDWSESELIIEMAEGLKKAVTGTLNNELSQHRLNILMQIVAEGKSIREITEPLAGSLRKTENDLECCGLILYTRNGYILADKSVVNVNGLFLRIERKFEGQTPMREMAAALNADETWLAGVLGLEIV